MALGTIPKSIAPGGKPLAMSASWLSSPLPACHPVSHLPSSPEVGVSEREGLEMRTGPFTLRETYRRYVSKHVCLTATHSTLMDLPCSSPSQQGLSTHPVRTENAGSKRRGGTGRPGRNYEWELR